MWAGAGEDRAFCVHIVRVSHNRKAVIFFNHVNHAAEVYFI